MTADIARFGADKLLTEQQLEYFRSQDGQITLRMWEMNQQQNNYLQMQAILGNTQLANALAVRTELSAACASNAERIELDLPGKRWCSSGNAVLFTCFLQELHHLVFVGKGDVSILH